MFNNLELRTFIDKQEHIREIEQDEERIWLETEKVDYPAMAQKAIQDIASFLFHSAENPSHGGYCTTSCDESISA